MTAEQILKQTLRQLYQNRIIDYIKTCCAPIDYTRTREIPALIDSSKILKFKDHKLKILDIGSPQILSLLLSNYSKNWDITYVNSFNAEIQDMKNKLNILHLCNLNTQLGDITNPSFYASLEKYDYIFSCSVFEHIYPEFGGDVKASSNIYVLLKPNGVFSLSIPYWKKHFHEYKTEDIYAIKNPKGKSIFFQRFYNHETLLKQIIKPSKLTIENKIYIGERFYYPKNIHKRLALIFNSSWKRLLFGQFYFLLSSIFMTQSNDANTLKKPYLAILSLKKINENNIYNNGTT